MSRAEESYSLVQRALQSGTEPEFPDGNDMDFEHLRQTVATAQVFQVSSLQYFETWHRELESEPQPSVPALPTAHCFIAIVGDTEDSDMFLFDDVTGDPVRALGIFLSSTDRFRAWFAFETSAKDVIFDAVYLNDQWYEQENKLPSIVPELVRLISH